MPRKYHRPPAVKRRKSKRQSVPYTFEAPPESDNGATVLEPEAETLAAGEVARIGAAPVEDRLADTASSGRRELLRAASRHLNRDYSYVRREIVRILLLAGFLLVALIITSFFR